MSMMSRTNISSLMLACLASILASAVGCRPSPKTATVSGTAMVDGQPLADGVVTFRPMADTSGPEFSGKVVRGAYRVPINVRPGNYAVEVRSWKKSGKKVTSPFGVEVEETVPGLPEYYAGPQTTLSAKLTPGSNTVDFPLTAKRGAP